MAVNFYRSTSPVSARVARGHDPDLESTKKERIAVVAVVSLAVLVVAAIAVLIGMT